MDWECRTVQEAIDVVERYGNVLGRDERKAIIQGKPKPTLDKQMTIITRLEKIETKLEKRGYKTGNTNNDKKTRDTLVLIFRNSPIRLSGQWLVEEKWPDDRKSQTFKSLKELADTDTSNNGLYEKSVLLGKEVMLLIDSGLFARLLSERVYAKIELNL